MIVKDEEAMLPAALASAAPWVDEIVVVDTGSTDRTPQIAASFGARVYHHPWQRNFSLHRNQSIGYCTGEWVFILDADEELQEGSGPQLRRAAAEAKADVVCAVVHNVYDRGRGEGTHVSNRLLRNSGRIHYRGRVHNALAGYQTTETWPIHIRHKGYDLGEAANAAKFERTATLLREQIADDPTRPRPHHFLAVSYLTLRRYEEAVREAGEAIRLAAARQDQEETYIWTHFVGAMACLESGRLEEAEQFARDALARRPDHFDSWFVLARVALERHDWEATLAHTGRYLELAGRFREEPAAFGLIVFNTAGFAWHGWHYRGVALSELGRVAEAEEAFAQALAASPDRAFTLRLRGRYCGWARRFAEAREWFAKSLALCPDEPKTLRGMAAAWQAEGNSAEERRTLERLLAVRFEPEAAVRLSRLYLEAGELEAARAQCERVLEAQPENVAALIELGLCLRAAGEPRSAIVPLAEACRLEPGSALAQVGLAQAMAAAGEHGAAEALERALVLVPGLNGAGLRVKLCALALEAGDVERLLAHSSALLRLVGVESAGPLERVEDLARLLLRSGGRLLEEGLPEAAQEAFGLAGRLAPGLCREAAALLRSRGLFQEALGQLEAALAAGPAPETLEEMEEVYRLLGMPEAAGVCRAEACRMAALRAQEGAAVV
jgi:tetratricopeptide (TPR) repeat protein